MSTASLNIKWLDHLRNIMDGGQDVESRNYACREIIGMSFITDMDYPIITITERKLGYAHMFGEAAWILSGNNKLQPLLKDCPRMSEFSDDGRTLRGAYGPPFKQQLKYVIKSLTDDAGTRQAVMTLWRPSPRKSKDIPCTVSLQWLIRYGYIHCVVYMRSSDAWLGLPYDIFAFTMMTQFIRMHLLEHSGGSIPQRGMLSILIGSAHIYGRDFGNVMKLLEGKPGHRDIHPMCYYDQYTPAGLLKCLRTLRDDPKRAFKIW